MPTADPEDSNSAAGKWRAVLKNARGQRYQAEQLVSPLRQLASTYELPPTDIVDTLVRSRTTYGRPDDPLIYSYTELLLQQGYTDTSSVLFALLRHSRFSKPEKAERIYISCTGFPTFEERIFTLLANTYSSVRVARQCHGLAQSLGLWLHAVTAYESGKQLKDGILHTVDSTTQEMYEHLGILAHTVFSHDSFKDVDMQPWWAKRRAQVATELINFDIHVLQWMHSQYAHRLTLLAKAGPFLEKDAKGLPILTDQQVLSSIADLPFTTSRAGLFIWLNACLGARLLTDDTTMRNYLLVRYSNDMPSAAIHLLLASFDVLTNAMLCREPRQSVKVIRSFISNKVPLLLSSLSGFLTSASVETCIQTAFTAISMDPLAPLTHGATEVREQLKSTRLDFLQACALHGIVSEVTISAVLNESVAIPRVTRLMKENLMSQCTTNTGRLDSLIQDLDGMQGNAGAIAGCLVDTINILCANKDTMSLKTACHAMIRKVSNLDVVMQYTQPANLLLPLCTLLNNWSHDQDQSEFQPPYEEFASILLLILVVVHRYDLQSSDLGLVGNDSFMAKMLQSKAQSLSTSDLTEEQNTQLSKWIQGLYTTDDHGEITGIGDEVMLQCPPQSFYLLVPNLFEQSVLACKTNALSVQDLKGGLEFLLEPFLLPSLVGGLSWLIKHSWEDHGDADVLLHVLDKLLRPPGSSQDTQAMHRAILATVATPLERTLQKLIRRRPEKSKLATDLVKILSHYLHVQRSVHCSEAEIEAWLASADGQATHAIRKVIRDLAIWAASGASNPPPKYTHRLIANAEQLAGVENVLIAYAAELNEQTNVGMGPVALDICTALICAPIPSTYTPLATFGTVPATARPSTLNLLNALRLNVADVQKLLDRPSGDAEALVRLSRSVEAQLAVSQMSLMTMQAMPLQNASTDQMMQDLAFSADMTGMTDLAGDDMSLDQAVTLDQTGGVDAATLGASFDQQIDPSDGPAASFSGMTSNAGSIQMGQTQNFFDNLDLDLSQAPQQGLSGSNMTGDATGGQQDQEDDIFAGLDMSGNFDDDDFRLS